MKRFLRILLLLPCVTLCILAASSAANPGSAAAEPVARVLVLGDSVFHSFHHIKSARRVMNEQQTTIFATQTCQRLVTVGCRPAARLSSLDQLQRFSGKFSDVVVVGTGYNDRIGPEFRAAVKTITDEARQQGVDVLWVTYREVRQVRGKARVMNEQLRRLDSTIDNLFIADWNAFADKDRDWFRADRLHLVAPGAVAMAEMLNANLAPILAARDAARSLSDPTD